MARQIVITGDFKSPSDGSHDIRGIFFLTTPAALIIPKPAIQPFLPPVASWTYGYTAAELAALQAGTITQQMFDTGRLDPALGNVAIRNAVKALYDAAQSNLNAMAATGRFVGAVYDDTSGWTVP